MNKSHLDDLPKIHPRTYEVVRIGSKAKSAFAKAAEGLTFGEVISVLADLMQEYAKYVKSEERHGDASKPADTME